MLRFIALLLLLSSPAHADGIYSVDPDFKGKKAQKDISGAACGPQRCLTVNDETHSAQVFRIEGRRLVPGSRIRLQDEDEEIDAEAIAYADGHFYITGSHGLSRKKAKFRASTFRVFRLTGQTIERTSRLRQAILSTPALRPFAEQPLDENGSNIEGLAAIGDRLFFGFRGPSIDGEALILETSAKALFSDRDVPVTLYRVVVGTGVGIRDMAAVKEGLLILTGPVTTLPRRYSIVRWQPATDTIQTLARVPRPENGKPEGLLVLGDGEKAYNVLIFHDGLRNGAPSGLTIPKP